MNHDGKTMKPVGAKRIGNGVGGSRTITSTIFMFLIVVTAAAAFMTPAE